LILIKINQCTDDIESMKKHMKKLKEDIETLGNGFSSFKTEIKQEIEEDLSTRFYGIIS
jgi:archaellum component FlaC